MKDLKKIFLYGVFAEEKYHKSYIIYLIFLIILFRVNGLAQKKRLLEEGNNDNQISFTVDLSKDNSKIINTNYNGNISEIIINECSYNFSEAINQLNPSEGYANIIIKFNKKLTTCDEMFKDLPNIINMDFSNFDSSSVTSMKNMFDNCNSLTSLNLANLDTSSVINMTYMFHKCSRLKSLDLQNFNTSKVSNMTHLFMSCSELETLNLNNFNTSFVKDMYYMFTECRSLQSLDLSHFDTSLVTDMRYMFENCTNLKSLKVSNFNTSLLTKLSCMFNGCHSLTTLDLSSFDTSSVTYFGHTFEECNSLVSLDLSNFDTSKVTSMSRMFLGCKALKSLNLKNFNTSKVTDMKNMFSNCNSLTSLDLDHFDTSKVKYMDYMFYYCSSLLYLNLYNFNTSTVTSMKHMFHGCLSLISLNINNFDTSNVSEMQEMFKKCSQLISLDLRNFSTDKVTKFSDIFLDINNDTIFCISDSKNYKFNLSEYRVNCSDICFIQEHKIIEEEKRCVDSCLYNNQYLEYNNICYNCPNGTINFGNNLCEEYYKVYNTNEYYKNIPNGYYLINEKLKLIDKCDIKCNNCTKESQNNNLCLSCNTENFFYPKYNDTNNNYFIECYNISTISDGYFLDESDNFFKQCYQNCKSCNGMGTASNQKCLTCKSNYNLDVNNNNCNPICEHYYYINSNKEIMCTTANSCPDEYRKLIVVKSQCIDSCSNDNIYQLEYNNKCFEECPLNTKLINETKICVDSCENDTLYQFEYNNKCYKECPENKKIIIDKKICLDFCTNDSSYTLEYNNTCYEECPQEKKLISEKYICVDSCENDNTYKIEYNNKCYKECPVYRKLIKEKNICVDTCLNDNIYILEYNNICYKECPDNKKLIKEKNICVDSCLNDSIYTLEYNNTCYKECPDGKKLINEKNICIDFCLNDSIYTLEYNDTCYNECPNGKKLISEKNICLDSCLNDDKYTLEYNNKCYNECPDNKISIGESNLCVDPYEIDSTYELESTYINCDYYYYFDNNNDYQCTNDYNCPFGYKLINGKGKCIDYCINDNIYNYKYEYNNTCYEICPKDTGSSNTNIYLCELKCKENNKYFNYEKTQCIVNITEGYYCNNTEINTIEKCHNNCKTCKEGPSEENNNCETCKDEVIYFDLGNCTDFCINGEFIEDSIKKCKCTSHKKCNYCDKESKKLNLCLSCNEGYYKMKDDKSNFNQYINCYNNETIPINHHLNIASNQYEECHKNCKSCEKGGTDTNNNCKECKSNYTFILNNNNIENCYEICNKYYYFDSNNEYICDDNCPKGYKIISKNGYFTCEKEEEETENVIVKEINNLMPDLASNLINKTTCNDNYKKQEKGNYDILIYKNNDCSETSENNKEIPIIDFGECYEKIKEENNIPKEEELVVSKVQVKTEKNSEKTTGYAFYHPYTLQKLDSSSCENKTIYVKEDFSQKLESIDEDKKEFIDNFLDQGINILDGLDDFYRDLCFHYKSPNGKDIPIKVRLSFLPNITLCEEGCENIGVDLEQRRAKCVCKFKDIVNLNVMGDNLYVKAITEVLDVISELNIAVIKCIKDIFNKEKFISCTGAYIIMGLFAVQVACLIKFVIDGLYYIRKYIYNLTKSYLDYIGIKINDQNFMDLKKNNPPKKSIKNARKIMRKKIGKSEIKKNSPKIINKNSFNSSSKRNIIDFSLDNKNLIEKKQRNTFKINKTFLKKNNDNKIFGNNKRKTMIPTNKKKITKILNSKYNSNISQNKNNENIDIKEYLSLSFNEIDFDDVIAKEKTSFCKYFCEKFMDNQIFINTFYKKEPLRPMALKCLVLIITIELYFIISALFYNEKYLTELFYLNEEEKFFSFIPRRLNEFIYTSIVSSIISYLIDFFFIEEHKLKRIFLRNKNSQLKMKYEISITLKDVKRRFYFLLCFSLFLTIICYLYISCFNNVYPYIKIEWIKSSLFILILMQIINFIMTFLHCSFRFISIKCKSERIFKLSQMLIM